MKPLRSRKNQTIASFGISLLIASFVAGTSAFAVSASDLFFNVNASDPGSYSTTSPTRWTDLSPTGRNGTIVGTLNYNSGTGALEFPNSGASDLGSNAYVDMGDGFNNFGTGITIEFEGHFGAVNQAWERIFDFGNGAASNNIWVGVLGESGYPNELAIELFHGSTGKNRCISSNQALLTNGQPGVFAKYVITLDGTTCRMYKNGVEIDTRVGSTFFPDNPASLGSSYPNLPLNVNRTQNYIGKSNWGTDASFNGAIKYVRIYTAAISSTDVTNNSTSYTLTYSTTGSESGSAPSAKTGNGLITLDGNTGSLTKTGYTFTGWAATANQSSGSTGSYNLSANTTLYPAFALNTYNVTFVENGGSTVSDGTFTHGGSLTYPANPTKSGYTFLGWFAAASGGTAKTAGEVASANTSVTLHAQWSANTYNVTFDEHGGSAVSDTSYVFGNTFNYPNSPTKSGYSFSGWFDAATGGSSLTASTIYGRAADSALHAQWSANTYNVTYDEHGGSTVSDGSYLFGNTLSFPTSPTKTGHTFLGWFDASTGGSSLTAATVSSRVSNSALHAQWSPNTYNVTYDEHGGTAVSDGTYIFGNTLTFPSAPTRAGYSFAGWFANASGGSQLTAISVSAGTTDVTLHAQWTPLPAQNVTWAPTNTSVQLSQSPVTPSAPASTSGDGVITYSVFNAGATGCAVNSNTGVVTFSGVGACTIRATASSTVNYLSDTEDVVFSVGSSSPAVSLNLDMTTGATVANSTVDYAASGLQNNSAWTLIVRSNPQTIASGTFTSGLLNGSAQIPSGLGAGWHSITMTGIGSNGNTISHAVWFEVSNSGTLLQTSGSGPTSPTSNVASPSSLANTGMSSHAGSLAVLVLAIGSALLIFRRFRASR